VGLGGVSQDEQTGDGEEDASEDIHGSLIDPVPAYAVAGVVASRNFLPPNGWPGVLGCGAGGRESRPATGGLPDIAPFGLTPDCPATSGGLPPVSNSGISPRNISVPVVAN